VSIVKNTFAVVGQGYVGLPLAIAAAEAGITTLGVDLDVEKTTNLNSANSHIEDITNLRLENVLKSEKYRAVSSYSELSHIEFIAICVPTPIDENGLPDISILESALKSVGENMGDGSIVIIESTISPGTTRDVALPILNAASNGKRFGLVYSPERIDPANPTWNVSNTPKLISGIDSESCERAKDFYSQFVNEIVVGSSVESIETAKLLENTFRLINISFINEFSIFCQKMGLDVREVIEAAGTKPYGFMKFFPGPGIGGHCIPVDPAYLAAKAKEIGAPTHFIDHALEFNHSLGALFAQQAQELVGDLVGKQVLLVGVAYKPNVGDVRETPALPLKAALTKFGAQILWHDEKVGTWQGEASSPLTSEVELVILVNPHSDIDIAGLMALAAQRGVPVLDTRGRAISSHS